MSEPIHILLRIYYPKGVREEYIVRNVSIEKPHRVCNEDGCVYFYEQLMDIKFLAIAIKANYVEVYKQPNGLLELAFFHCVKEENGLERCSLIRLETVRPPYMLSIEPGDR